MCRKGKVEGRRNTKDLRSGRSYKTWYDLLRMGCIWGAQPEALVVYKEIYSGSTYCKAGKNKENGFSSWILMTVVSA